MLYYLLAGSFFLAFVAAVLKTARYVVDYRRLGESFYLMGIPANIALAGALALLIVGSGPDPIWRNATTVVLVRLLIALWAVFSLLFELLYGRTYLVIITGGKDESAGDHL